MPEATYRHEGMTLDGLTIETRDAADAPVAAHPPRERGK